MPFNDSPLSSISHEDIETYARDGDLLVVHPRALHYSHGNPTHGWRVAGERPGGPLLPLYLVRGRCPRRRQPVPLHIRHDLDARAPERAARPTPVAA